MFVPERNLKDLVVSYIKREERSISALTVQLKKDGFKFHRLFVTGYLKALADVGMLREREIPPAKVYTASVHRERDLYEAVGDRCRQIDTDERAQARLAVAVLHKLFRRPIFYRELKEAGFEITPEAVLATKDEKEEAVKAFRRLGIPIPANEPAYYVEDRKNEARDVIIAELLAEKYGLRDFVLGTRQMRLGGSTP
ncbi:MAG TPA: hypothetical protein VIL58_04845 [Thermoplasmata archaeon]